MGTVIRKELRGYFNSAIALIFLAAFLAITMYTFFWREKFFARGLADLRPLFEWMPRLLIIMASALAMRMWADERRTGTLEVLLTLPVPRWQLVIGKFLAGMIMVAVALLLTASIPLSVAKMGNLDFGPVVGGYLAAMLLAAAYLAIGMCVSAGTDNQVVAFIVTAFACGLLYLLGDAGNELGRYLGAGARFESVARGVLDLRDLAYYGTIVCIGLAANIVLLQRVTWGRGPSGRARRVGALIALGLIAANAVAFDLWLAPIKRARIDLTQSGSYSLSSSTERILSGLDEQLTIRGYFSDKTFPKLAPYAQQIRDLLEEYRLAGRGKVRVEISDPTEKPEARAEAKERYGIEVFPIPYSTAAEKTVLNVYFAIGLDYGDQHIGVTARELTKWRLDELGNLDVQMTNVEYQLTRAIKKAAAEFASLDTLFASTPGKVQVTAYMTPKDLPENWKDAQAKMQKVGDDLAKQSGGKLVYTMIEPKTDADRRDIYQKFGIEPYPDFLGGKVFYFHILVQVGNRLARILPPQTIAGDELKKTITEGLKRAAPGFTRVVGLAVPQPPPPMPPAEGMPPQQQPPPATYNSLQRELAENYEVRPANLGARISEDLDVLVIAGPAGLGPKEAEYIDQFVMRGGALVVLDGRFRLAPADDIAVEPITTGLEAMFTKWGITVEPQLVVDPKNEPLVQPKATQLPNGMMVRDFVKEPYPFFVKVDGDQLDSSSAITASLVGSVMHFASPVKAETKVGEDVHRVDVLMRSSTDSWTQTKPDVTLDTTKYPGLGVDKPAADKTASSVLAVAVAGGFASSVSPAAPPPPTEPGQTAPPKPIQHSPPDTRVVVFGSSVFVSDDLLRYAEQMGSQFTLANLELVHNAIDWALADTDLLEIRSRNASARALTVDPDSVDTWRTANVIIAFVALLLITGFAWLRRRGVQPVTEASP